MHKEQENFEMIKKEESQIETMLKIVQAKGERITEKEDYEDVIDIKKQARTLRLKVEKLTKPFLSIQKEAYNQAKLEADKYIIPLKEIEGITRNLIVNYEAEIEKEIQNTLTKAAEKIKKSSNEFEPEGENQIEKPMQAPLSKSAGIRKSWKVKSIQESLLPEQYFIKTPNIPHLNEIAKFSAGKEKIPGVIFEYC